MEINSKMEQQSLEIVNRFICIIAGGENKHDRLQTEWEYLYKLLRTEPVAYDRIDAYLNILQQQDSTHKKANNRTRNSQTQHPEAKKYQLLVASLVQLMADNEEKLTPLRRGELAQWSVNQKCYLHTNDIISMSHPSMKECTSLAELRRICRESSLIGSFCSFVHIAYFKDWSRVMFAALSSLPHY